MMALEGGSFGFQIGRQVTDFVLLVMNEGGARGILAGKVKLGGDASVRQDQSAATLRPRQTCLARRDCELFHVPGASLPASLSKAQPSDPTTKQTSKFMEKSWRPNRSCSRIRSDRATSIRSRMETLSSKNGLVLGLGHHIRNAIRIIAPHISRARSTASASDSAKKDPPEMPLEESPFASVLAFDDFERFGRTQKRADLLGTSTHEVLETRISALQHIAESLMEGFCIVNRFLKSGGS